MKPIRNSAKAIIIRDGKVLLTKNKDDRGHFYLFPGGGQEPGEQLTEAVIRECMEEIGAEVEVGDLVHMREYISKNHEFSEINSDIHQVEFYFRCRLKDSDFMPTNGTNPDCHQVAVEWVDLKDLEQIRLYPKVLGTVITNDLKSPIYLGDVN
ncbi:NUDIX domain-containing protein [Paenibacillus sp. DYY-L-2]|uniref:NUDIX domain-containing protein n=1 Tax=Paenibacillus sp. DYY-L-2 TaxID=3447013 RepID=UPI003F5002B8